MDLTNEGVNENGGVVAPAVESPVTQTQQQKGESAAGTEENAKSTETLNTGKKVPESVPYQRFKEVNDEARAAKELLAQIYHAMNADEEENKVPLKEAPKAEPIDPISLLTKEVTELKNEKIQEKRVRAVDSYDEAHNAMASKEIPQELRDAFDEMVASKVLALNKGIPTKFDPKILEKAYSDTKKIFAPALEKMKPVAPAANVPAKINGDTPVKPTSQPRTFAERRDLILKALEAGKKVF
ncbi:MAG: hypothetical protein SFW66_08835 [Gammaproteobacteria bacterium]|nr:hypothetical protein [Gammaproteobacteria bacterium]